MESEKSEESLKNQASSRGEEMKSNSRGMEEKEEGRIEGRVG